MRRHLLLVGLPGSGKTTAGELAASLLGAEFLDVDRVIERDERLTVSRIFSERGEAAFRLLERNAVARALGGPAAVIAPGGGWAAHPGNWDAADERAVRVYLSTRPETAAQRVAAADSRPLLLGDDPLLRMRTLFAARRVFYERAEAAVETDDRTPMQVAQIVAALARARGGW